MDLVPYKQGFDAGGFCLRQNAGIYFSIFPFGRFSKDIADNNISTLSCLSEMSYKSLVVLKFGFNIDVTII